MAPASPHPAHGQPSPSAHTLGPRPGGGPAAPAQPRSSAAHTCREGCLGGCGQLGPPLGGQAGGAQGWQGWGLRGGAGSRGGGLTL